MSLLARWRGARRPRALLAWEIGAGFTHARNALGVVAHLAAAGVDCTVALADPRFEPWFRAHGARVLQTWLWPPMRVGAMAPAPRAINRFSDILASYGALDPAHLAAGIAHYDTLFDLAQPDVLLCENAFAAQLAARGRIPTIVYGSTLLFIPPRVGDDLVAIMPHEPPSWPEDEVLDALNAALGASARPPLAHITEMMDCAAILPFGPAAFDPYAAARSTPVLPPYCPDFPHGARAGAGDETIVYLHESAQASAPLMDALARLPPPLRIYIPALAAEQRAAFEQRGFAVETSMLSLDTISARGKILVHHGGVGLAAVALALGLPQVVLARFHDNAAAGQFVADRGLGAWLHVSSDADAIVAAIAAVRNDSVMRARALQQAPDFARWFDGDPTLEVARKAAEVLGLKTLQPSPPRDLSHL